MRYAILLAALALPALAADRSLLVDAEQALAQGRTDQARKLIDNYVSTAPDDPRGPFLRAIIEEETDGRASALADYDKAIALDAAFAPAYQRRGIAHFMLAHVRESIADFDKYLDLRPDQRPYHWQRGIALYYARRYEDAAKQFELHKTVNPDDVENAAWHFLCVARWKGVDAARAGLIPVTGDERVPMAQVQQMFAGKATPEGVLAAAKAAAGAVAESGRVDPVLIAQQNRQLFYAHLYIGLYEEALNHPDQDREHLTLAAEKYAVPDYMHGVARVHLALLNRDGQSPKP
jgi:lipoprotein NlpI